MKHLEFKDTCGTFLIEQPENYSGLYFPLAGEVGLKSSISPTLGGDSKTDQNHFLLEPVSIENLHNNKNTRNFWCHVEGKGSWSVCGSSAEQEYQKFTDHQDISKLEAGFMWQKVSRKSEKYGLCAEVTSFVTLDGKAEVELVDITNVLNEKVTFTPIAAVPIYGRSADNIRDHRHVTSLLHRIVTKKYGVEVTPVLSFDERGHQVNHTTYFVYGSTEEGESPESFYPTVESFIGEGGTFLNPAAVRENKAGYPSGVEIQGKEAVGGIQYAKKTLAPQETTSYIVLAGVTEDKKEIEKLVRQYQKKEQVYQHLEQVKEYWNKKVNVAFYTGNLVDDSYLKWICFQPILRRIYGCSFLPYHDYGKGGRGWRDLWQDCLALLIMEPDAVRQMIVSNYGGVRIDGTNATIIGTKQGEFIADRNNITRVWMDHAFWPFVTTKFYMDQTGDLAILFEKIPYFKDLQAMRGEAHDDEWNSREGNYQKTADGRVYTGSVLEHILLQNLCAFYDVGEHNEMRLHGADWNDALDMAWERGESVAFTCAYAGNLWNIAQCLRKLQEEEGIYQIELAEEMDILLSADKELYDHVIQKQNQLKEYTKRCIHTVSGKTILVSIEKLIEDLEGKAEWIMKHIREQEWITDQDEKGWFNGYYDNHGQAVEYSKDDDVRMMLTGQVFAIMSGTATPEQIRAICKSADEYLFDKAAGGYRLNTDFGEEKFDLGRMFGFAYGEKENGAVFSHMTVMYANALYKRGFAKEGYKVLQTLLEAAEDFKHSRMYPGLPEYFDNSGRGLYAYLTGAASWYMLTMITEVFGVRGDFGDLVIAPALMPEQFDKEGHAVLKLSFAGKRFILHFYNAKKIECGKTQLRGAVCGRIVIEKETGYGVRLTKEQIATLASQGVHEIEVVIS